MPTNIPPAIIIVAVGIVIFTTYKLAQRVNRWLNASLEKTFPGYRE